MYNTSLHQPQNFWLRIVLTKIDQLTIINSLRQHPFLTILEMAFRLVNPVSKETIRRYLTGYIYKKA